MPDDKRALLKHFLAALAYRTQKALRDAPADFGGFRPQEGVRSPAELVRHMTSVLGYACTLFTGGRYRPEPLPTLMPRSPVFTTCSRLWRVMSTATRPSPLA